MATKWRQVLTALRAFSRPQMSTSAATKRYERPARTRDLAVHEAGKGIIISGTLMLAIWFAVWFGWIAPYTNKVKTFFREYDAEKVFFRQRQAGVFQSCRPLKDDDPEYWLGTYSGSDGSESVEDVKKLFKRFPDLGIKIK